VAGAGGGPAVKAPRPHRDRHGTALPRQVAQMAVVATENAAGWLATGRASRRWRSWLGDDREGGRGWAAPAGRAGLPGGEAEGAWTRRLMEGRTFPLGVPSPCVLPERARKVREILYLGLGRDISIWL
jgi:hypothetical protein